MRERDIACGTFFLASYTDTGAYNDATTFQAELFDRCVLGSLRERQDGFRATYWERWDGV